MAPDPLSPDLSVPEIMTEFGIETLREMYARCARLQNEKRLKERRK